MLLDGRISTPRALFARSDAVDFSAALTRLKDRLSADESHPGACSFCPILMPTLPLSIPLQASPSLTPVPLLSLILLLPFSFPSLFLALCLPPSLPSLCLSLYFSLALPLTLFLFRAPALALSATVSLRRLVTPGETLEPLPFPSATLLRRRPPPPASINPTNQEARICPFELSGWLAALCCTRNFV